MNLDRWVAARKRRNQSKARADTIVMTVQRPVQ
jgi:hypothetical protein